MELEGGLGVGFPEFGPFLGEGAWDSVPELGLEVWKIVVAITVAHRRAVRDATMAALLELGCRAGNRVQRVRPAAAADELGADAVDNLIAVCSSRCGEGVRHGSFVLHSNRDLGAKLASGSHRCQAMVVVPCSMKTLAGVAHGLSRNLIERAADVMLKERRTARARPARDADEPAGAAQHGACAEAGATILPAMPAFYQQPKTIDDLAAFMPGKS